IEQTEGERPGPGLAEIGQVETGRADAGQAAAGLADTGRAEAGQSEAEQTEGGQAAVGRAGNERVGDERTRRGGTEGGGAATAAIEPGGPAAPAGWISTFLDAQAAEASAALNTRLAYGRDLLDFAGWLAHRGGDFSGATREQIEGYLAD